jgi:hypothetical protein
MEVIKTVQLIFLASLKGDVRKVLLSMALFYRLDGVENMPESSAVSSALESLQVRQHDVCRTPITLVTILGMLQGMQVVNSMYPSPGLS